ncbi:MAG TPA: ABC transporter ATP-binding protein [Planctomycetota bacterium]|nr:ABC transporter ATP-binding protein [Planctomycetota bacterium]
MKNICIQASGLGKRYDSADGAWAVRGVNLKVVSGEVTVLMGPSGSGKTTLLTMMGCLLKPCSGALNVLGLAVEKASESAREKFRRHQIGFIFQNYNLLAALTAEQNVRLALQLRGAADQDPRELLESVGLANKAGSFPDQLSGGQRQRVAIARALAGDPALVLADEPTAALDAEQGRRVMELLRKRARQQGTTVVVVTHDPRVIQFADTIVELEDGSVRRQYRPVRTVSRAAVATAGVA